MRPFFAASLVMLLAACPPPIKQADPRSRTVTAGASVVLDNFAFWNRACDPKAFTRGITQEPANGTITVRDATYVIPNKVGVGSSTGCVGKSVASQEIVYTPNVGFSGPDVVGLSVSNQDGGRSFVYQITVN